MKVLDDLAEGKYMRTMVTAADSSDREYHLVVQTYLWVDSVF